MNEAFGKQSFGVDEWLTDISNDVFVRKTHSFLQSFGGGVTHEDAFFLEPDNIINSDQFEN